MVAEGTFREDLYYRISVVPIIIPPLRERNEDILILAQYFVEEFNKKFGKKVSGFSKEAKQILMTYPWPGNVRELKNIIERVMILQDVGTTITPDYLPSEIKINYQMKNLIRSKRNLPVTLPAEGIDFQALTEKINNEVKEKIIGKALDATKGNKTKAAKLLGISRYKLLREHKKSK